LESVYTGNRIVGSNPTPSAKRLFRTRSPVRAKFVEGAAFGFSGSGPVDSEPSPAG
jgi:hypothetical protein